MNRKLLLHSVVLAGSLCAVGTATAESRISGEMMANACAPCHGTYGHLENEYMPPLAGMPEQDFIEGMKAFREGTRPATIMDRVARAFSDEEIEAMAEFYAQQTDGGDNE